MKKIILFLLFSLLFITNMYAQTAPYAYTTLLNLGLWHQGDTAGYAAINAQWWKIDSAIVKDRDSLSNHLTRLNAMPTLSGNNTFAGNNYFASLATAAGVAQRVILDNTNKIRIFDSSNNEFDIFGSGGQIGVSGSINCFGSGSFLSGIIAASGAFSVSINGKITEVNSTAASGSNIGYVLRSDGYSYTPAQLNYTDLAGVNPYVYNLYNSYTQAGYSIGNSAGLPPVWQAIASTAPGEIKLRLLYRHRAGNKNIRLQADIYGSVISANVAIGIGKDSLNSPIGVVYASTFSTSPSTQTVELPVSSFTPGNTYMIDVTLRDANAIGSVYMTNVIVDVENY